MDQNTEEYSLSELHGFLSQTVRGLSLDSQKLVEVESENMRLQSRLRQAEEMNENRESDLAQSKKNHKYEIEKLREQLEEFGNKSPWIRGLGFGGGSQNQTRPTRDANVQSVEKRQLIHKSEQVVDEEIAVKLKELERDVKEANGEIERKKVAIRKLEEKLDKQEERYLEKESLRDAQEDDLTKKNDQLEKKVQSLGVELASKDKNNAELFEALKKMKIEIEAVKPGKEPGLGAKRPQSSYKKGEKGDLGLSKQVLETAEGVQAEINETKLEVDELYKRVDKFYMERSILYQSLDQQLKRNRALAKEINFLRSCVETFESQGSSGSLELEMLSNEETQVLLDKILRRAANSLSMQKKLRESAEFLDLCTAITKSSSRRGKD